MDYSYLNQAGFDPSSAMSSLQSAAAASAAVSSEANFYSDLSGSCPSVSAAMMPGNYGPLTGRYPVMRSPYGHSSGMPGTPTGSPSSSFPRNPPEHHRQSMFGASGMGLNCKCFNSTFLIVLYCLRFQIIILFKTFASGAQKLLLLFYFLNTKIFPSWAQYTKITLLNLSNCNFTS